MAFTPAGVELIAKGVNQYLGDLKKADKAQLGLGDSADKSGGKLSKLGGIVTSIGLAAGAAAVGGVAALTAGVTAFAVGGIKQAITLDQKMADIAAIMGETKAEVEPIKDLISDLALDPNLKVNATEAADAIQMLAQNGVTMEQILGGAAKSTVALANATGADFSTAANVATDAMLQFNLEAKDLPSVMDSITGVVNGSKFSIDDVALALSQAGGVAGSVGVDFQDFATVIAATSSSFASGSDAGTSFKTFLSRLSNPTDEMKDKLNELNISLFDSNGKMRSMVDVQAQLQGAFAGMTEAQKAETAAILGGADASRTVLALANTSVARFQELTTSVNASGQAFAAAATRVDSVQGALDIFKGIVEAIQLQIGDAFLPIIKELLVDFANLATRVGPQVIAFFERITSGLAVVITTIKNGLQPGSNIFAEMFSIENFAAPIEEIIANIPLQLTTLTQNIAKFLTDEWPTIQTALLSWVTQFWGWVTTLITQHPEILGGLTGIIAKYIYDNWATIKPSLDYWAGQFWLWTTTVIAEAATQLGPILTSIGTWIESNWPAIMANLKTWSDNFWLWATDVASQAGQMLAVIIASIGQWAQSAETQAQLLAFGTSLGQKIVDALVLLAENSGDYSVFMTKVGAGLVVAAGAIVGILAGVGAQIVAGIMAGILEKLGLDLEPATFSELSGIFSGIAANIKTILIHDFEQVGTNIMEGIKIGITGGITLLSDELNAALDSVIASLMEMLGMSSPSKVFADIGTGIVQGMIDGISSMLGSLSSAASSIFSTLTGGGDEATMPTMDTEALNFDTTTFTDTLPMALTNVQTMLDRILLTAQNIGLYISAALVEQIVTGFTIFDTWLLTTITKLTEIHDTRFPAIDTALQNTVSLWTSGFTSINALLTRTATLLTTIQTNLNSVAAAAQKTVDKLKKIEDTFELFEILIELVEKATEAFQQMAEAAAEASSNAKDAGEASAARTGVGFSKGVGFMEGVGFAAGTLGWKVPPGYNNDTFPMRVQTGEEVMVTPRGMTIEDAVMKHYPQQANMTLSIGSVTIANGMDLAMFQNVIRQTMAEGFG